MNEQNRCNWCLKDPLYIRYHDEEWGVPVYDDKKHFEFLVLESAQAGLSWLTVLRKRQAYHSAFSGFDPVKVAAYNEGEILELLSNPGIIRNRLKIKSAVNNARRFLNIQEEFGSFNNYIWNFVDHRPVVNTFKSDQEVPSSSDLSDLISGDLKRRGFTFVGSTIVYAHLQATGLINDHVVDCFRYNEIIKAYKEE
jgi:DNA-3-methyladenine glycosylase I